MQVQKHKYNNVEVRAIYDGGKVFWSAMDMLKLLGVPNNNVMKYLERLPNAPRRKVSFGGRGTTTYVIDVATSCDLINNLNSSDSFEIFSWITKTSSEILKECQGYTPPDSPDVATGTATDLPAPERVRVTGVAKMPETSAPAETLETPDTLKQCRHVAGLDLFHLNDITDLVGCLAESMGLEGMPAARFTALMVKDLIGVDMTKYLPEHLPEIAEQFAIATGQTMQNLA